MTKYILLSVMLLTGCAGFQYSSGGGSPYPYNVQQNRYYQNIMSAGEEGLRQRAEAENVKTLADALRGYGR